MKRISILLLCFLTIISIFGQAGWGLVRHTKVAKNLKFDHGYFENAETEAETQTFEEKTPELFRLVDFRTCESQLIQTFSGVSYSGKCFYFQKNPNYLRFRKLLI